MAPAALRDAQRDDLITQLVQAEEDGHKLSNEELTANIILLFGAGHESAALPNLATQWFLAEGATGSFFDLDVTLASPAPAAAPGFVEMLASTNAMKRIADPDEMAGAVVYFASPASSFSTNPSSSAAPAAEAETRSAEISGHSTWKCAVTARPELALDPTHHLARDLSLVAEPDQRLALGAEDDVHHPLVGERAVLDPVVGLEAEDDRVDGDRRDDNDRERGRVDHSGERVPARHGPSLTIPPDHTRRLSA